MKKIILLLLLLPVSLFCQNKINPPPLESILDTNLVSSNFNKFVLGWNWGSPGTKLDEALHINFFPQIIFF